MKKLKSHRLKVLTFHNSLESNSDTEDGRGRSTLMQKLEYGFSSSEEEKPSLLKKMETKMMRLDVIKEQEAEEEKEITLLNNEDYFENRRFRNRASTVLHFNDEIELLFNVMTDEHKSGSFKS